MTTGKTKFGGKYVYIEVNPLKGQRHIKVDDRMGTVIILFEFYKCGGFSVDEIYSYYYCRMS